jgi:tripartite-type tricarboxylate transporter receptor subunit TctC
MGRYGVCEPPFGSTAMHKTAMRWGGSASRDEAADLRYAITLPCDDFGHAPGFGPCAGLWAMRRVLGASTMLRRPVVIAILGCVLAAAAASAQDSAANFPDHPIRVIVSVPAGGGVDSVTRIVTAKMSAVLSQPLVVENKAGAGGSVAAEAVFKDAPDGYTLLASQPAPITTNPFLYKSLNYDPAQLTAIAIMSHVPNVILVREGLPVKTVQELIAYAKANPGKLNYASQGIGTTSHLTAELFQTLTQTKLVHVPYKGTAPALTDLLAGNVDLMFNELATSLQQHKAGKARILAVLTKERIAAIPDIPTIAEAGVAGCESDTWHALTAPPKTPAGVVAKLNDAVNKAMKDPELLERYKALSISPGGGTPAEMDAFLKAETKRWGDVIHTAGIQPQ